MPSFPGSVKTFTTKVDGAGNTIFAAHINDVQDEITAIEQGLVQGSAPIVSSRISAPALSISASSTLAALVIPSTGRVACKVSQSANVAVGAGGSAGISWNVEDNDPASLHSTSVNSSQVLMARVGPWEIGAYVTWNPSTNGGYRDVRLVVNDATVIAMQRTPVQGLGANTLPMTVSGHYVATAITDYWTVVVSNDAGSTQSLLGGSVCAWASVAGA